MANITPDFLSPEQLTAFREILEAKNFQLNAAAEGRTTGMYADYITDNFDDLLYLNAPQIEKYNRVVIPPFGDIVSDIDVKAEEVGAARAMMRYRDIPPNGKRIGVDGDVMDARNPSFNELIDSGEIGDRTYTRAIPYIATSNPESIDYSLLRSYYGTPEERLSLFTKDPSKLVSRDWWANRPILPSQYDPRAWESRARGQVPRMLHFQGLERKLRGVATQADIDNIWIDPFGHNDLLFDQPTTAQEAIERYNQESLLRERYLNSAGARRNQLNRQIAVGQRRFDDPKFAEKLDGLQQAFRDARKYLTFTTPSQVDGVADYMGGHPELARLGDDLSISRPIMGPAILDEGAADAWNFMTAGNKAGALPAIEAMVDYNKFINGTNLSAGLYGTGQHGNFYDFTSPRTKGGYLGSNFAPQLEALYENAVEQDRLRRLAFQRVTDRYQIDPKFRSAVNKFIPNTLRTPTAGAVGGVLSMAGQVIDATDSNYMNRNYRGTDPLAIRPLYDLLLAPASGQSYSDAGRAYEKMVADPEYVQRNPLSSMVGQAVRGDLQYLKAFLNAYNPFQ